MIMNSHVHFPRLRSVHAFPKGELRTLFIKA